MSSLSHVGIAAPPAKFAAVVAFYARALAPLGYTALLNFPGTRVGMGSAQTKVPDFWISSNDDAAARQQGHNRVQCERRTKTPSAPSTRRPSPQKPAGRTTARRGSAPQYRPTYHAAFVLDPLGNSIEALRDPGAAVKKID